jgi:defect-in-organelle-trafficking protein DotA
MIRIIISLLCLLPIMGFAEETKLSFAPPPSDMSMVFLGNLFGIVDGVLHGSGSQIMGTLFSVFNSAVMALGGIIIMYTLMVSTLNTAQEGEMLGKKWNTVWVPIRSTIGLALLIPKASGYCMMQIFIMWIVVQGVGAADKIWENALDYLNRGGVIIQRQTTANGPGVGESGLANCIGLSCYSTPSMSIKPKNADIMKGAGTVLSGQVCMIGLQKLLNEQYQLYQRSKQNNAGPCYGTPSPEMSTICSTIPPDFVSTVNMVAIQNSPANVNASMFTALMPNFDNNNPYSALNGICGKVTWYPLDNKTLDDARKGLNISEENFAPARVARAIALQQMYVDLSSVAQVMVNNDPLINPSTDTNSSQSYFAPDYAKNQFGIPYSQGSPCTSGKDCTGWGSDNVGQANVGNHSSPIFSGTEFLGAVTDYQGVMLPTLNILQKAKNDQLESDTISFINDAKRDGWFMAGAYFFNLVRLSQSNNAPDLTDSNTGIGDSQFDISTVMGAFDTGNDRCKGPYAALCTWFQADPNSVKNLTYLIKGKGNTVETPSYGAPTANSFIQGQQSATVNGFIMNSMIIRQPGQPGMNTPKFEMNLKFDFNRGLSMQDIDFPCGKILGLCIGRVVGEVIYNSIIRTMMDFFLQISQQVITSLVLVVLYIPLQGIATVFRDGVSIIQAPNANPIVAIANMGTTYINFANEMWINLIMVFLATGIGTIFIPGLQILVMGLIMLVMPLMMAWLGIMVSIGFITAYYLPFLPYMLFTFGAIGWLTAVIEAMVAGPIVALGVTHPEGHDSFGKGEQAIMILMNVFLRPALMVIGYIAGIAMTFVSVWMINAGFSHAMSFIQGDGDMFASGFYGSVSDKSNNLSGYTSWALIYGFFFSVLIYTTMYLTVIQKSFNLISYLPDKVLRWIGGQPEGIGQETSQWSDESKQQVKSGGEATDKAAGSMDKQLSGQGMKGVKQLTGAASGGSNQAIQSAEGGSKGAMDAGGGAAGGAINSAGGASSTPGAPPGGSSGGSPPGAPPGGSSGGSPPGAP